MTEPVLSVQFFDVAHGLHASARTGTTLLFEGSGSTALPQGPRIEAAGDGWRAELEGRFELALEPVAAPAVLDGLTAHLCAVTGNAGGHEVDCLGTLAETRQPPVWERLEAVRTVTAVFDRGDALLSFAQRPLGATGHDAERTATWLLRDGTPLALEEVRLSTVYDGEGRQRSAGFELWAPGEDFPLRISGTVVAGSSLQLEGIDVHAAIFRWRMEGREGTGAYELMTRARQEAA